MILPLRSRHRATFLVLLFILPAIFVAGHLKRKPLIESESINVTPTLKNQLSLEWMDPINEDSGPRLMLKPRSILKAPDLLIYWNEFEGQQGEGVPNDSYLLGSISGVEERFFTLPFHAEEKQGFLLFFSLADRKMIESINLEGES